MTRTPKAKPIENITQTEVISEASMTLRMLASEVDAMPFKVRAGKLPEIIRAIAEALK
jgi:hypothetical protein